MCKTYAKACGAFVSVAMAVCASATAAEATGGQDPAAPKQNADTIAGLEAKLAVAERTIAELKQALEAAKKRRDEFQDLLAEREKAIVNSEKENLGKVVATDAKGGTITVKIAKADSFRQDDLVVVRIPPNRTPGNWFPPPLDNVRDNISGKVTSVNAQAGWVTIDQGAKSHVEKGFSFIIYRDDNYVGKVVVEEVSPDSCKARYIKELMREDPKVGDSVALRLMVEF